MQHFAMLVNVAGRRCVIVGGGSVAVRRATSLCAAGAEAVVIAPVVDAKLRELGCEIIERSFASGDLEGAWLVVIASDDAEVNQRVAAEAVEAGVLVNRADDPEAGDVIVPASGSAGPIGITVHTSGISAAAAARIRDQLLASLDASWIKLLDSAAEFRSGIQSAVADAAERQQRLRALTGERAMRILRDEGEAALRRYHQSLADPDPPLPDPDRPSE